MAKESRGVSDSLLRLSGGLPIECWAVGTVMAGRSMPSARESVMAAQTAELIGMRVASWAIESVEPVQHRRERRIIADAVRRLGHRDEFVYDHRPPSGGERYSRHALSAGGGSALGVLFGFGRGCGQTVERSENPAQRPTSSRPLDNRGDEGDVVVASRFRVQSDEGSVIDRLEGCRDDG
jgi:hypothetical protein